MVDNSSRVPHNSRPRGKKQLVKGEPNLMDYDEFQALQLEERIALIQELIPLGLMAVANELNREVDTLVGAKHQKKNDASSPKRYGYNPGTVRLGGHMVPIKVPRIRNEQGEISLRSYALLHGHSALESENILKKVLNGVPVRKVADILPPSVGGIGTSKSAISKKVVDASKKNLKIFMERDLSAWPIIAMFIDGTHFAKDQMIIALGICLDGSKRILGFVQAGTENSIPIADMLRAIQDRGMTMPHGLLAITDGSKGIKKALREVFGQRVLIQRCQWHKRENIVGYLPKEQQDALRKRLQVAYNKPTMTEAHKALLSIKADLSKSNISAEKSLDEGIAETLTLHRIGMFALVGLSLKTTNCIESLNARVKNYCSNVDYWKNSSQKCRWLATALLEIEPTLHKIKGHKHVNKLCVAIAKTMKLA